jgi:hypothetical protein
MTCRGVHFSLFFFAIQGTLNCFKYRAIKRLQQFYCLVLPGLEYLFSMSIFLWLLAGLGLLALSYFVFAVSVIFSMFRTHHEIDKNSGWEEFSE